MIDQADKPKPPFVSPKQKDSLNVELSGSFRGGNSHTGGVTISVSLLKPTEHFVSFLSSPSLTDEPEQHHDEQDDKKEEEDRKNENTGKLKSAKSQLAKSQQLAIPRSVSNLASGEKKSVTRSSNTLSKAAPGKGISKSQNNSPSASQEGNLDRTGVYLKQGKDIVQKLNREEIKSIHNVYAGVNLDEEGSRILEHRTPEVRRKSVVNSNNMHH